ncbi:MAG: hypothetical protein ACI87N_001915 [Flavobacteriales bacterium]|jgi:hypothetical protein
MLRSKYKQFDKREVELELLKNGQTIERQIVRVDNKQRFYWMLIGNGIGFSAYKLWTFIIEYPN